MEIRFQKSPQGSRSSKKTISAYMKKTGKRGCVVLMLLVLLLTFISCGVDANTQSKSQSGGDKVTSGLKKNATVLFMGDSITDGGRKDYSIKTFLGANHPKYFSEYMTKNFPNEKITVYNTGVSGDTLLDQYFRLKEDCFDLKPDYIIMLLGVNDAWFGYKGKAVFEKTYRLLLDQIIKNTNAKLILMEPYLFEPDAAMQKACVISNVGSYIPYVKEMDEVIRTLAAEYQLPLIRLSEIMEKAHQKGTPYAQLASDAIHPTAAGVTIILDQIMTELKINGYKPRFLID